MPRVGEAAIIIPGFMGSRLVRQTPAQTVWLDPEWNLVHLQEAINLLRLTSPGDDRLVADALLQSVPLGMFSPQIYTPLLSFLTDQAGYAPDDVYTFPFDWRRDIAEAAYALDAKIGRWASRYTTERPFVLLAHSYGGLVAAHALYTGNHTAARTALLITFGVPFAGVVKTLASLRSVDELSDLPISPQHVRELLGDWPAVYDLMPYRERHGMVRAADASPTTPTRATITTKGFRADLARDAALRLRLHETPLPELVTPDEQPLLQPRPLPVPVRVIVGSGITTASTAQLKPSGTYTIISDEEGDGTTPVRSALDVQSTTSRRIYPVPYGYHVGLVKDPLSLAYLRTELRYGTSERFIVLATARSLLLPAGAPNEITIELRDAEGNGMLAEYPPQIVTSRTLRFTPVPSASEPNARLLLRFRMPSQPVRVTISVPGLPTLTQPPPLLLAPLA